MGTGRTSLIDATSFVSLHRRELLIPSRLQIGATSPLLIFLRKRYRQIPTVPRTYPNTPRAVLRLSTMVFRAASRQRYAILSPN